MSDERWESPFEHSLPFFLFRQHFTEINEMYWAHVPAANTIQKKALESLETEGADPKNYFLIPDEDDRKIAPTLALWKENYREFLNYTRLNMLMQVSSCFETYLRTIVALAVESKPGALLGCQDSIDGAFLLKTNSSYGIYSDNSYQFANVIDEICRGEWSKRISSYQKYFSTVPLKLSSSQKELDEMRHIRNLIGHYIGRKKQSYEIPLYFKPEPIHRLSHKKLLKFFALVYRVVSAIDEHLHKEYIASYDIIKVYFQMLQDGEFSSDRPGIRASELRQSLGSQGMQAAGKEYYHNLVSYCDLDNTNELCRYGIKACIKYVNRKLNEGHIDLIHNDRKTSFTAYHFNLFCKVLDIRVKPEFCVRLNYNPVEYRYSLKAIDYIVQIIVESPDTVIDTMKAALHK